MSEPETYDTYYEDEVVCPHCGHREDASYELLTDETRDGDTDRLACGACDREYIVTFHIEPRFSTEKPK